MQGNIGDTPNFNLGAFHLAPGNAHYVTGTKLFIDAVWQASH